MSRKKLTRSKLRELIKEEVQKILQEEDDNKLQDAIKKAKKILSDEDMEEKLAANAVAKEFDVSTQKVLDAID